MAVSKMRWSDADAKEIARAVKNFNQKLVYQFKTSTDKRPFLPSKVTMKDLKSRITSRQDFHREINALSRFSKRGTTDIITTSGGVTMTKYALKEAKNLSRISNIKKTWERKVRGITIQAGNMLTANEIGLTPTKTKSIASKGAKDFEKFIVSMHKRLSADYFTTGYANYKKNYLQGITNELHDNKLYNRIKAIPAEDLYAKTATNARMRIRFMYEPQLIELKIEVMNEEITRIWG